MKVRIIFYKAKFEWRNFLKTRKIHLVDDIISWWTFLPNIGTGPYSHVEVWLPRGGVDFQGKRWRANRSKTFRGTCYTSTMRGNEKGTCSRPASEVFKHPERWEFKEFEVEDYDFNRGKAYMDYQVRINKGYGLKEFATFIGLGWLIGDDRKNICSEFCHNYAALTGILDTPFKVVSPRRLSRMLPGKMQRLVNAE